MQNVVIFGASGHGSVVLDCIEKQGKYKVIGFIDSFKKKGININGYTVLGSEVDLPYLMEKYNFSAGIIAIGDNWSRKLVVDRILKIAPNFDYISAVHPKAEIGKNVDIGKGTVLMAGVIVNANSVIGDFCILNTNASLDHDGRMENYSSFAPKSCAGGNFRLGKFSAICLGSNIIDNITILEHSVIGAGSLVVGNIEGHILAYGSPAKKIRNRIAGEPYLSGRKKAIKVIPFLANDI